MIYPPGSRIGLAPPPGLAPSRNFFGYEDPDNNVAIILVALPVEAYAELDKTVGAEVVQATGRDIGDARSDAAVHRQGVPGDRPPGDGQDQPAQMVSVASSPALTAFVTVQVPDAAKAGYPDEVIRAALSTLAVRATVPIDEQLGLVPFKIRELAGFR